MVTQPQFGPPPPGKWLKPPESWYCLSIGQRYSVHNRFNFLLHSVHGLRNHGVGEPLSLVAGRAPPLLPCLMVSAVNHHVLRRPHWTAHGGIERVVHRARAHKQHNLARLKPTVKLLHDLRDTVGSFSEIGHCASSPGAYEPMQVRRHHVHRRPAGQLCAHFSKCAVRARPIPWRPDHRSGPQCTVGTLHAPTPLRHLARGESGSTCAPGFASLHTHHTHNAPGTHPRGTPCAQDWLAPVSVCCSLSAARHASCNPLAQRHCAVQNCSILEFSPKQTCPYTTPGYSPKSFPPAHPTSVLEQHASLVTFLTCFCSNGTCRHPHPRHIIAF